MLRAIQFLVLSLLIGQVSNAALLVTYNFTGGVVTGTPGVFPTVVGGAFSSQPLSSGGAGVFAGNDAYRLGSANVQYVGVTSFTVSTSDFAPITVESINFDLGTPFNPSTVTVRNSVNGEAPNFVSTLNSFGLAGYAFAAPLVGNSITFTFDIFSLGANVQPFVDNLQLKGFVGDPPPPPPIPEPASMAVLGGLFGLGLLARRRFKK
jgi:hypothetical protein